MIEAVREYLPLIYMLASAGFILAVAPWSGLWEHNRFAETWPAMRAVIESPYVRGAVSGVGVITAVAGVIELGAVIVSRSRRQTQS